jgi:hypothetical protein
MGCAPLLSWYVPLIFLTLYPHLDEDCHRNYHSNFYIEAGQRTYYSGMPKFIQVSEHHFVELRLTQLWTNQMLFGVYVSLSHALSLTHSTVGVR